MRALVDESLDALSAGHVALANREKRAFGQLSEYMPGTGLKTERQRNNWMAALKKKHKTNIYREGELVRHRLRLTIVEAAEWLELSKAERDAKRAEMDAAADKQGVLAENVGNEVLGFMSLEGKEYEVTMTAKQFKRRDEENVVYYLNVQKKPEKQVTTN